MSLIFEIVKFIIFSALIVIISKYLLVTVIRKFAETLDLKAKTVGNIAGIATSVPELLTISVSSFSRLISASIYNVVSSNVINLIQYSVAIYMNKNLKVFKNTALKTDIYLVLLTIIIPLILIWKNIEADIYIVPLFVIMFILFSFIDSNVHKLYLKNVEFNIEQDIEKEKKWLRGKKKKTLKYSLYLALIAILLFIVGNLLSDVLENLCNIFGIKEYIIGILLGFITSIPELITFFESQKHYKKEKNEILGVVEATNNLLTSNVLNLFVIQSIGIIIYWIIA